MQTQTQIPAGYHTWWLVDIISVPFVYTIYSKTVWGGNFCSYKKNRKVLRSSYKCHDLIIGSTGAYLIVCHSVLQNLFVCPFDTFRALKGISVSDKKKIFTLKYLKEPCVPVKKEKENGFSIFSGNSIKTFFLESSAVCGMLAAYSTSA